MLVKCKSCDGTGKFYGRTCQACGGDGYVDVPEPPTPCAACNGEGHDDVVYCPVCKGTGYAK